MATETSEGDMQSSDEAKSEERKTSAPDDKQEQSSTMKEETFAEPNEKTTPNKESSQKKSEGRKHLLKMVSSIGEKEGGKPSRSDTCSWEQKVDEAYTELILSLQEAWESHVSKIRSQLRKIMAQPRTKGTRDFDPRKHLFNVETTKGSPKEEQKRTHLAVLITVSVLILAICVINNVRIEGLRHELAVINQEHDFLREKLGAMMEKVDMLPEVHRKQNKLLIEEMRKEIRYIFHISSRETRVL
ncbi:unnamed protein product [Nezara viridula]|uniref:Uncharacterized protein n=1 Tax=Nezara viridula TaxID=85310 RepID=A0A9P0EBT1_NEZVI|nr:unnamed protein product [Nezara viridula]